MNRTFVWWLVGLAVVAVALPTPVGFALTLGLLVLVLVTGAWTASLRRTLEVEVAIPDRLVQGEVNTMRVAVRNGSRLPAPRIRVEVKLPPGRLLPGETVLEVALPGRAGVHRDVEVTAFVRGRWHLPPTDVWVADPWGIWLRSVPPSPPPQVTVLPAIVRVRRLDLPAISPLAEVPDRRSLTTDPTAIVGVRPYEPGDPLRTIHWPATAASGTLVRRETERAWARDLIVVLDLDHARWDRFDDQPVEVAISTAASLLTHAILGLRQPAGLVASVPEDGAEGVPEDPAGRRLRPAARFRIGASRSHLDAMLVHLASVTRHRGVAITELVLREAQLRAPGTTVAVVTGPPSPDLLEALATARRAGLAPVLLEVGERTSADAALRAGRLPRFLVSTARPVGRTEL